MTTYFLELYQKQNDSDTTAGVYEIIRIKLDSKDENEIIRKLTFLSKIIDLQNYNIYIHVCNHDKGIQCYLEKVDNAIIQKALEIASKV